MSTQVVDYAKSAETRASPWSAILLNTAFACALLPMVAGVLITGAKLLTGRPMGMLDMAGALVIVGGVLLFFVGITCCSRAALLARRAKQSRLLWPPRVLLAAALLLANFPLAYACITVATLSRVRVVNNSAGVVTSLVVSDPARNTWQLGPIAPGKSASKWMRFDGEGEVVYAASTALPAGTVNSAGTIDGYITSGMSGERYVITINPDGTSTPPP